MPKRRSAQHAGGDQSDLSATSRTLSASAARTISRASCPGAYLAEAYREAKLAIVYDKTPYGQDETKNALNGVGLSEVLCEGVPGDVDFSVLVAKTGEHLTAEMKNTHTAREENSF